MEGLVEKKGKISYTNKYLKTSDKFLLGVDKSDQKEENTKFSQSRNARTKRK